MKPILIFVIALALPALVTAADPGTATQAEPPYRATVDADGVQRVQVIGGSYFFQPRHILVKVNVPMELTVQLESVIVPHNLVLHAPDAGISINDDLSRDPKHYRFTPTVTGRYPFYCSNKLPFFRSHRERGMEGVLEVID